MNRFYIISDEGMVCSGDHIMIYDLSRALLFYRESWARIVLDGLIKNYAHLNLKIITMAEFGVISIMVQ